MMIRLILSKLYNLVAMVKVFAFRYVWIFVFVIIFHTNANGLDIGAEAPGLKVETWLSQRKIPERPCGKLHLIAAIDSRGSNTSVLMSFLNGLQAKYNQDSLVVISFFNSRPIHEELGQTPETIALFDRWDTDCYDFNHFSFVDDQGKTYKSFSGSSDEVIENMAPRLFILADDWKLLWEGCGIDQAAVIVDMILKDKNFKEKIYEINKEVKQAGRLRVQSPRESGRNKELFNTLNRLNPFTIGEDGYLEMQFLLYYHLVSNRHNEIAALISYWKSLIHISPFTSIPIVDNPHYWSRTLQSGFITSGESERLHSSNLFRTYKALELLFELNGVSSYREQLRNLSKIVMARSR